MLNLIILVGRLTKTPQLYSKEDATDVVNFDIAVDNLGKDAGTTFLSCKAFGKVAQNVNKFCDKGSKVAISGRLQQRNFIRKDGSKSSAYEVICDSVEFLDSKAEEPSDPEPIEVVGDVTTPEPKFDPMTGKPLKPSKK